MRNVYTILLLFFCLGKGIAKDESKEVDSLQKLFVEAQKKPQHQKDTSYILLLSELANAYRYEKPDTSLQIAHKALALSRTLSFSKGVGRATRVIGIYYRNKGEHKKAIEFLQMSVEYLKKIDDADGLAFAYNSLSAIYKKQANSPMAIEYCMKALQAFERINNKSGMAYVLNNLSSIYNEQTNYDKALEYAFKSLKINEEIKDKKGIFFSYYNISETYKLQEKYRLTLDYLLKNIKIAEEINYKIDIVYSCNNIALMYIALKEFANALPYIERGLALAQDIQDQNRIADLRRTQAKYFNAVGNHKEAYQKAKLALEYTQQSKNVFLSDLAAYELSIAAQKLGKYEEAYHAHVLHKKMADSLSNEKKFKDALLKEFEYEEEKRKFDQQKRQMEHQTELQKQKDIQIGLLVGFLMMLGVAFFAYRSYKVKQKANKLLEKQKTEIKLALEIVENQRNEIKEKNDSLHQMNKDLYQQQEELLMLNENLHQQQEELLMLNENLARQKQTVQETYQKLKTTTEMLNKSIEYASHIQSIMMPEETEMRSFFSDLFVIFQPRDVVSGDFYWFSQIDEKRAIFALADCTGHGVPGAFMSMLGNTLLNEVVNVKGIYNDPARILRNLNSALRFILKQEKGLNSDGMDIGICYFEKQDHDQIKLIYAGAKSIMFYVENGVLHQVSGSNAYVGGRKKEKRFENQEFIFSKSVPLYLLTDGIIDQNNEEDRRFGSLKVKETILALQKSDLSVQKQNLLAVLQEYQGNAHQRDDISIIGLKI